MTAYVVLIRESVTDIDKYENYRRCVPASLKDRDLIPIAQSRTGRIVVLEGAPVEGVTLFAFPTIEAATAWYNSPEYEAARREREGIAECRLIAVSN